ncbi:hypothetical protein TVAG_130350 [Trichomonas vaginalis G3]|uniref:Uncharacterized protein n=1 Tax=Trichomonas vaginalis (strain ATCC PRA-98 / G3) TaxID=412133 RepID=A2DID1_TRIV3|nr:spectrin binding [Trichomonas vaginalis G3]EAY19927.1 hypothetical protein TVAG_130350 [Trichomonas vaginalis G3]KAI5509938.1 spectrin binding [Trichomonas vaginalis G3]|eukprot:XP_001580913.1 hypothetical protein [Trichomonas vaginalis G3]
MISFLLFWRAEDFFYQKVFNDPIIFPVTYSINNVKQRKCSVNKDDETISCPQGTNISNSAFVTATINNLPSGYFNILNFTCNSLKANPKQEIQIIIRSNGTGRSYFFKPDGSEQSNPVIPIVNNSQIEAYFLSHEGESIFKLPQLKIINPNIERKEYGKPKLTKIEKNVYRASVEVTPTEKLYIQSMFISNSFGLPKTMYEYNYPIPDSKTNVMIIPVIANESIIIGIDVYNDEYFCAWHQRTDVEGSYMELSIKPKRTFTLTYLIIEKESVNLRDSLEKWHLTFKDIYCNNTFGLGAWVAFPRLNQFKEDYIKPLINVLQMVVNYVQLLEIMEGEISMESFNAQSIIIIKDLRYISYSMVLQEI